MRQIQIFFNFSKAKRQFVWLFTCFVRIVNLKLFLFLICTLAEQFQVHKSYKSRESTFSCIGNLEEIVFCCYNCLDLPWEKFFQVWVTFFPSSWEQEYCVEKRLCKFEAVGREFVTFSRHYSCLRELGKKVTNTWKKLWAWYKSRQL